MPIFEIETPDGTFEVEAPDEQTAELRPVLTPRRRAWNLQWLKSA